MNEKQVNDVKDLAPRVMKVLEGLEVKCPRCKGDKVEPPIDPRTGITRNYDECLECNGLGKIHYSWQPQVGEWCIVRSKLHLITEISGKNVIEVVPAPLIYDRPLERGDAILILPWEEIERVLEKAGYWADVSKPLNVYIKRGHMKVGCSIYQTGKDNFIVFAQAKSRQEAVMKAVLKLEKELKC